MIFSSRIALPREIDVFIPRRSLWTKKKHHAWGKEEGEGYYLLRAVSPPSE